MKIKNIILLLIISLLFSCNGLMNEISPVLEKEEVTVTRNVIKEIIITKNITVTNNVYQFVTGNMIIRNQEISTWGSDNKYTKITGWIYNNFPFELDYICKIKYIFYDKNKVYVKEDFDTPPHSS